MVSTMLRTSKGMSFITWLIDEGYCNICGCTTSITYRNLIYVPNHAEGYPIEDQILVKAIRVLGTPDDHIPNIIKGDLTFPGPCDVDHIVPISVGGLSLHIDNLQTLCKECHVAKTSRENKDNVYKDAKIVGDRRRKKEPKDAMVQFRVSSSRKQELEDFAQNIGLSVGAMLRGITETVEVLYDPELKFSDVIRSIPDLKELITSRKDQTD